MNIKNISLELSDRRLYHIGDHVRMVVHDGAFDKFATVEGYISQISSVCNSPNESKIKIIDGNFGEVYPISAINSIEVLDETDGIFL